jgi:Zinc-ribbon containing domain
METNDQEKGRLAAEYDKLARKFSEIYLAGKERGRESMSVALDKAREQLTALGELGAEHGEELKQYLARDLDQTIADAQHLGEEAKARLHPARVGAGALSSLAAVLELTGNALRSLGEKTNQRLTYKTGEMASAGTLTCQSCGHQVHIKETGHVPPCAKCNGTLFHKSY